LFLAPINSIPIQVPWTAATYLDGRFYPRAAEIILRVSPELPTKSCFRREIRNSAFGNQ
jgi:hypothetical protein